MIIRKPTDLASLNMDEGEKQDLVAAFDEYEKLLSIFRNMECIHEGLMDAVIKHHLELAAVERQLYDTRSHITTVVGLARNSFMTERNVTVSCIQDTT